MALTIAHIVEVPKPGDYGLINIPEWNPITYSLGWRFNHCFIYIGNDRIVHAWSPVAVSSDVNLFRGATFYSANPTDVQRQRIVGAACSQIGRLYDWSSWPLWFPVGILKAIGIDLSWIDSLNPGLNCSALVATCYRAAGIELTSFRDLHLVTPKHIDFEVR